MLKNPYDRHRTVHQMLNKFVCSVCDTEQPVRAYSSLLLVRRLRLAHMKFLCGFHFAMTYFPRCTLIHLPTISGADCVMFMPFQSEGRKLNMK
ncbi:hypothetical protein Pint_34306 [Pistacia integerrima]|uniref:Uncharacterized protein n=1 Tax=Pistacia integerrima TaxID=434235 RepID=A0ACC0X586_9ROSI|nr:hypothetical protein Pint_34306 [Pistacia integerrima]